MGKGATRRTSNRWTSGAGRGAAWALLTAVASLPFLAGTSSFSAPAAVAAAGEQATADGSTANPPSNEPRTPAMQQACGDGSSAGCQQAVLGAIDKARSAEGVGPLELPSYFDRLSVPEQVLVVANKERLDRGLPGFTGLSSQLDALAMHGALSNDDPNGPNGTSWGSNWAGGEASALLADYDWMYDDGPGSPNLDCTSAGASGCWDHRLNVLADYGAHPSMGAASAVVNGVTSLTELFSSGAPGQLDYALPSGRPEAVTAPAAHPASARARTRSSAGGSGYWQATSNGAIFAAGGKGVLGSAAHLHLARPVVGIAGTPSGAGYWEVAADGGVFSFGNAKFFGSAAMRRLPSAVVGMAGSHDGRGYWLATKDGNIYSYGDAKFYGALRGVVGGDVVAMSATPDGRGYWLVTGHGSVYSFGDAKFFGPKTTLRTAAPVVGIAPTPGGRGYWLVTRQGNVYPFGNAGYFGAPAELRDDVVGIAAPDHGEGYYVACADGRVFSFGSSSSPRLPSGWHSSARARVVALATS